MRRIAFALLCVLTLTFGGRVAAQTTVGGTFTMGVGAAAAITVQLSPDTANVAAGANQLVTVSLTNDSLSKGATFTLTGAGCSGVTCGTLSAVTATNGQVITYTAPATPPSPSTVNITATSIQDPTRFDITTLSISAIPPPPVVRATRFAAQTSIATNTFPITPTAGNAAIVSIGITATNTITAVNICTPQNVCTPMTQACPPGGPPCFGATSPGGESFQYYAVGLPAGQDHIVVTNSPANGTVDLALVDAQGIGSFDTATIASAQTTPTTNPVGPSITPNSPGELIVSFINNTGTISAVAAPFNITTLATGEAVAWVIDPTTAAMSPSWTATAPVTWSGFSGAYKLGVAPAGTIRVGVSPAIANVQVSATQSFTATVTNDNANGGVNWVLGNGAAFSDTFSTGTLNPALWVIDTGTAPGGNANNAGTFANANVDMSLSVLALKVTQSGSLAATTSTGAEVRSINKYGYGTYIWSMRSASTAVTPAGAGSATSGSISSGFIFNSAGYTEIDSPEVEENHPTTIEFTNWITSSTNTTCSSSLLAGADQAFHTYRMDWSPTSVIYYVDGVVKCTNTTNVPSAPAFILMNLWGTNNSGFGGAATIGTNRFAYYNSFSYTPACSGAACGTLSASSSPSGTAIVYTAPSSVPAAGALLTASSATDSSKSAFSVVTITSSPIVGVTVNPTSLSAIAGGAAQAVTATVANDPGALGVTWTLTGPGSISATISPSGTPINYTPPASVTGTTTATLKATSVADNTKSATATITVSAVAGNFRCSGATCPAFAGTDNVHTAQGSGATAKGGRAGVVYNITTLSDSTNGGCTPNSTSTCSLRDCIQASGARTCIFRVSGLITFLSRPQIFNPFITIAGQSAPGQIVIGGPNQVAEQIFISTHDVVIRYLSHDGYNPTTATGPNSGTVAFEIASGGANTFNIILDHISAWWYGNKDFPMENNGSPTQGIHDVTYQWNFEYEPDSLHPVGGFAADANSGSSLLTTNIDVHHNFLANMDHRLPFNQAGKKMRYVNNLNFNWNQFAALFEGGTDLDFIGNKYVDGNLSVDHVHVLLGNRGDDPHDGTDNCGGGPCDNAGNPTFYLLNNTGRTGSTPFASMVTPTNIVNDAGEISMTRCGWEGGETTDSTACSGLGAGAALPSFYFRATPNPSITFPITADPVQNLDAVLLAKVGNSEHLDCNGNFVNHRDANDARVIAQYQALGSGSTFHGQLNPPAIISGTLCTETLHDGIPDAWKTKYGLNTGDVNLYKTVSPNGFTYLESYLNGLPPQ